MNLDEALTVLDVRPGASGAEVRSRYRDLMRANHPDLADPADLDATERSARVNQAFRIVRDAVVESGDGFVPRPAPPEPSRDAGRASADVAPAVDIDGDTIHLEAPPDEAFQRLLEAAAEVGGIGHVDRHLGMLEVMVRFEGGPTCSVLLTLQGRAFGTDAFCTMDSIEAAPTPPIAPVIHALVEALASTH
jgi:hypothetical protein